MFELFSRHRSLKLRMIKSDRNVDVGKTSAKMFRFETEGHSVFFLFIYALKMLRGLGISLSETDLSKLICSFVVLLMIWKQLWSDVLYNCIRETKRICI